MTQIKILYDMGLDLWIFPQEKFTVQKKLVFLEQFPDKNKWGVLVQSGSEAEKPNMPYRNPKEGWIVLIIEATIHEFYVEPSTNKSSN